MKEIKFRVWDKRIKKMGEVTELRFSEVQHHLAKYRYINEKGKVVDEQSHFDKGFTNGLHIMQYTGLKDKNGNEIYEGDIVEIDDCIAVIQWDITTLRFIINLTHENVIYDFDNTYVSELDVVGNICENPEMISHNPTK